MTLALSADWIYYAIPEDGVFRAPHVALGSVEESMSTNSAELRMYQDHPEPFGTANNIPYTLLQRSEVTITVYDVLGRDVRLLASGIQSQGNYDVTFDATDLPSGVYFYRLEAGGYVETRRMVVTR